MDKYSSYVKYAVLALALIALVLFGFNLKTTNDAVKDAKNQLRSLSVSGGADPMGRSVGGGMTKAKEQAVELAVEETMLGLAASSGLAVQVDDHKVMCLDDTCLENYEGILRYLRMLSNVPMKLQYKKFCLGPKCTDYRGFGFEYNIVK